MRRTAPCALMRLSFPGSVGAGGVHYEADGHPYSVYGAAQVMSFDCSKVFGSLSGHEER